MLAPAIKYKEKLEAMFTDIIYSEDYLYYHGYAHEHELPKIGLEYGAYQYAIIDNAEIVGFLAYRIDTSTDSVFNFGLISFQKGNLTVVSDTLHQFKKLVRDHNRVEWRCVGGNPASKLYDKICKKYGGRRIVMHQAGTDLKGNIVDSYIYEILKDSTRIDGDDVPKEHAVDTKITNAERIRKMSNDELADFLNSITYHCHSSRCQDCPLSRGKTEACNPWIWLGKECSNHATS